MKWSQACGPAPGDGVRLELSAAPAAADDSCSCSVPKPKESSCVINQPLNPFAGIDIRPVGRPILSGMVTMLERRVIMSVMYSMLAIALGAAVGANLRWLLGLGLNAWLPAMPLGTLAANLLGAFLIGIAVAVFSALPELSPLWRLMVVTGFLGALTTFSTFATEIFSNLQEGRLFWAFSGIVVHVAGSLLMVGLGMATFALLRHLTGGVR